jgi:anti-sigma-K factor RskA
LISHEEYKEMLAVHALGAHEAEEARSLEAHLATCDECQQEMLEWNETAAALAYSAGLAEPSAQLRARILEGARAQPQSAGTKGRDTASEDSTAATSNVIALPSASRRAWSPALKFGALAASIAFAALLVMLFVLWNRNNAMKMEIARLTSRLNETQGELARERQSKEMIATRARQDMEMLTSSNVITLKGTDVAQGAHATLAYDSNTGRAMLVAQGLPPAPAGKAYQLWFIKGDKPLPGGVFTPDVNGRAEMRDQAPAEGRDANVFAVTLEPSTGVGAPTGDKYLLGARS